MGRNIALWIWLFISCTSYSQDKSAHLKQINKTWSLFYKAFETLDHSYMEEIHSKDLVRVSGGKRILNYDTYMANYKAQFKRVKDTKFSQKIELRFFERINNNSNASERGIYKLTINRGANGTDHYYGKFHVILKKTNGKWLITMDYDSNENNTIGEADFIKSYAINDIDRFLD